MRSRVVCFLTIVLGGGASLKASTLSWVEAGYTVIAGPTLTQDTGHLFQNSFTLPNTQSNSNTASLSALAEVYGSAAQGSLHGFAHSDLLTSLADIPLGSVTNAVLDVSFGDRLFFQSSTLAAGTPIQFQVTTTLHSTVSSTGMVCGNSPNAFARAGALGSSDLHTDCDALPAIAIQTSSIILSSTVGGFPRYCWSTEFGGRYSEEQRARPSAAHYRSCRRLEHGEFHDRRAHTGCYFYQR